MDCEANIKSILNSSVISETYLNCKYLYPSEVDELREKLLGEGDIINADDYLLENAPDFLVKQRKFKSLLENGHFNPYKKYQVNDYFVKTKSYEDLNKIFLFKNKPELNHNFIHIGNRGSGKTVLQNCWLYRNNSKLEDEKIFWVRCDGHKLYKLWLDHEGILDQEIRKDFDDEEQEDNSKVEPQEINIEKLVNLKEYFDIQLVYVFSKYILKNERKLFQNISRLLKDERPIFDMPVSKSIHHTVKKDLYERLLELNTTIEKEEKDRDVGFSYAFDKVMYISQSTRQIEKTKWIYTSKALQKFLREQGFWILRIIDGVDNVHINQVRAKYFYQFMLNQVYKFALSNPPKNATNYLAIRERTYFELAEINPIIKRTTTDIKKLVHVTPSIKKVISERYRYSVNNFFSDEDEIYEKISKAVVESMPQENNDYNHNNVRSFLYNKLSLISLVYYRVIQLGGIDANISSQVENLSPRNRFLNGRLFLNTKEQWPDLNLERGLCCINIFYFDDDKFPCSHIHNWYGMCKIRILQLLKLQDVSKEDLINYLNGAFSYPANLIDSSLYDLRAFGLVDSKYNESIYYTLSHKGETELISTFLNIDTLYYFSLDTLLPSELIDHNLLVAHSNKFNIRTRYPYSSLVSAVTFLIFLDNVNKIEREKHQQYMDNNICHSIVRFNEVNLPYHDDENFDLLISSIKTRIDSAIEDGEKRSLDQYVQNLQSILV